MRLHFGVPRFADRQKSQLSDQEIADLHRQRLRQAMDDSSLLIAFVTAAKRESPAKAVTQLIAIQRSYAVKPELSEGDEADFWLAYSTLANAARPATVEGIRHVALNRTVTFFGWMWKYLWITATASIVLIAYLIIQIHVVSGSTIVNSYDEARAEIRASTDATQIAELTTDSQRLADLVKAWNACPLYPVLFPCFDNVSGAAPDQILRARISLNSLNAYALPLVLALLGACTQVLRSIARRVIDQSMNVVFLPAYYVRVLLGLIIGGTIGLFLSPAASTSAANPLGFLATLPLLTAAFLAGYGVEIFFSLMDKIVNDARSYISGSKSDGGEPGK
jgi:hypothetical protein